MKSRIKYNRQLLELTSCSFLGLFSQLDWDDVIQSLLKQEGSTITTDPSRWNLDNSEYGKILKLWDEANFNYNSIKWTNYYPEKHFPSKIDLDVCEYLKLDGVHRSWISRVDPGYYAPWHWDVDDNEYEYLKKGEIKRYSIFITGDNYMQESTLGQIFILGNDYLYQCPKGSIFKWNNYKEWHAGINAGLKPKFMYHLIAY
jgi:hypothetical protein